MGGDEFNFSDPCLTPLPGSIPPASSSSATMASAPASTPSSHASVPASTASAIPNKPPRILACVLCQTRKIKCDRNFPCANCIKVREKPATRLEWGKFRYCLLTPPSKANVKCTPSTPAPARKRKRPNQDLQERLARCEELLKEYATEKPDTASSRPSQANAADDPYAKFELQGKLIEEDGSMRFIDSPLMTVYDEVRTSSWFLCPFDDDPSPTYSIELGRSGP